MAACRSRAAGRPPAAHRRAHAFAARRSGRAAFYAAFLHGLPHLGWIDGRNVRIDSRWVAGDADRLSQIRGGIGGARADVILALAARVWSRCSQTTRTVPIVFAIVIDPVGAGFVESLSRPGGNATGFTAFEYSLSGKWPELLKEIAPGVTRMAILRDPAIAAGIGQFAAIQSVAPSVGVELSPIDVRDAAEIERDVATSRAPAMAA